MKSSPKKIALFGATGSIGSSTVEIVRANRDLFSLPVLVGGKNWRRLAELAAEFRPEIVGIDDRDAAEELRTALSSKGVECRLVCGRDEIVALAGESDYECMVGAIVGYAGLASILSALKSGKRIALANKESLVCGGALVNKLLKLHGGEIIPVDSEHSALFQALQGNHPSDVSRLILTASGGPFLNLPKERFATITVDEALNHPKWKMGRKITIDSATLFNKALEVIEAYWLYRVDPSQIDVLVHPQHIIHSLVEYVDGTQMAQLSVPDMRGAVAYALSYPEARVRDAMPKLDLSAIARLDFSRVDRERFPSLDLAYEVIKKAGDSAAGVVFNAANEAAVYAFLGEKIPFTEIFSIVEDALSTFGDATYNTASDIEEISSHITTFVTSKYL